MKINIIECDELYPEFKAHYISYGRMFEKYFKSLKSELEFEYFYALQNNLPEHTSATDLFLITGSKSSVYDDQPWVKNLLAWIANAYASGSCFLGICFGHQALAAALGGKVVKSEKGWGVGVRELMFQPGLPRWLDLGQSTLKLIYSHQDQVVELPEGTKVLLADDFCPYAAFALKERVVGFQGHPEFDPEYSRRLFLHRASSIGEDVLAGAIDSLATPTDTLALRGKLISWFESTRR